MIHLRKVLFGVKFLFMWLKRIPNNNFFYDFANLCDGPKGCCETIPMDRYGLIYTKTELADVYTCHPSLGKGFSGCPATHCKKVEKNKDFNYFKTTKKVGKL